MSPRKVYVHVGLPKTGTTYLQRALWLSRDDLADRGVFLPGDRQVFHKRAVWDLLGRRARGVDEPGLAGTWDSLVETSTTGPHDSVVISEEFLVYARPRHVRQISRTFDPAELHVVVTVRDLGRVLGSAWQHELTKGHPWSWSQFVGAVRDPGSGPASAGVQFWVRYDITKVISRWEAVVPPERIHVVVVPPSGADPTSLLTRFAEAVAIDPSAFTAPPKELNTSVGVAEAEALRRLNESLGSRLNERQYIRTVKDAVLPALTGRSEAARITLPAEHHDWATVLSREWMDYLVSKPFHVVGDPSDLLPRRDDGGRSPDQVEEAEVAAATSDALRAAVESYAKFWWRVRKREEAQEVDARTRFASATRALGYRARVGALRLADRNRFFARIANAYVRRSSGAD